MTEGYGSSFDRPLGGVRQEPGSTITNGSNAPLPTTFPQTGTSTASDSAGTAQVAKDELKDTAAGAKEAGAKVAETAKDEAAKVTKEAGRQAKDLLDQSRHEVTTQLGEQQQRVAAGLKSLGQELGEMAGSGSEPGVAADLAQQASQRLDSIAAWMEGREPGALLDDVKSFARARPGAFLVLAAGAGVLAGRLTRGLQAASDTPSADVDSSRLAGTAPRHVADVSGEDAKFTSAAAGEGWATPAPAPSRVSGFGELP